MDRQGLARIEEIIEQRRVAHERMLARGAGVYRSFLEMERAAYSDGALERKLKELIAVGISVVIDCESCMEWHIGQALRAGAAEDEVLEAIDVGIEMGGGPATVSSRFALMAVDYHLGRREAG